MNAVLSKGYKSPSQITRVITEAWGSDNLFCLRCESDELRPLSANSRTADFSCLICESKYQLKASKRWSLTVTDSAYSAMLEAIRTDSLPHLLVLHYTTDWTVERLVAIPSFLLSESAIIPREPLRPPAKRAGWQGCSIDLRAIPPPGIIDIVSNGVAQPPSFVRSRFAELSPLASKRPEVRGWTLDVLAIISKLPPAFTLHDVYKHHDFLARLHPNNRHILEKIRQQIQVLIKFGYLRRLRRGQFERIAFRA